MEQRGRRKKVRYIQAMPKVAMFSPRGKPGRPEEIELSFDQFEAFKLADFQGYEQAVGAIAMGVSRPTFGRILREARRRIAEALVHGKILKIRLAGVQIGVKKKEFNLAPDSNSLSDPRIKNSIEQFKNLSRKSLAQSR